MHHSSNTIIKTGFFTLAAYCILTCFILLLGAFYIQPNSEELSLCQQNKDIGYYEGLIHMLLHTDGRYFTNILHAFNPVTFGYIDGYKLMPVCGIVVFGLTLFLLLLRFVTVETQSHLLLIIAVFIALFFTLSLNVITQFYQMAATFVYLWTWSFVFLWLACYTAMWQTERATIRLALFFATLICLFAALGNSEMFLILNTFLLLVISLFSIFRKRTVLQTLFIALFGLGCILFSVTAPGIAMRASRFKVEGVPLLNIHTIYNALADNYRVVSDLFFHPFTIAASIALYPTVSRLSFRVELPKKILNNWLLVITALMLLGIAYAMTLAYYIPTQNNSGLPIRIFASTQLLIQLAAVLLYTFLIQHLLVCAPHFIGRNLSLVSAVAAAMLLLGSLTYTPMNNLTHILSDYRSGKLQRFNAAFEKRYALLRKAAADNACYKTAVIPIVTEYPESIHTGASADILPNRTYGFGNDAWESYFKVDEILLKGDTVCKFTILPNP